MQKLKIKKGVSPIIATVLLIMITIVAVGIIAGFVIPMVKEKLKQGKSCFELAEYFKIIESDYSCYTATETKLMIERGMGDFEVDGFVASIFSGSSAKPYRITEDLPEAGGAKTYVFDIELGKQAEISTITSEGVICSAILYKLPECKEA